MSLVKAHLFIKIRRLIFSKRFVVLKVDKCEGYWRQLPPFILQCILNKSEILLRGVKNLNMNSSPG